MRASEFIVEYKKYPTREYGGVTFTMIEKDGQLIVKALNDFGLPMGHVVFGMDGRELDPKDLEVYDKYQGQGIASTMYDYIKSQGFTINRSFDQTDAGRGFWDKHRGEDSYVWEGVDADQVLQYVKQAHAPEQFDIDSAITDHPRWELKMIPVSQLKLDPDGEAQDPYGRVNWVDFDKVQDLMPNIGSVLKRMPIVIDSQGWIIDGNHRAMAAAEAELESVPAYVPTALKEDSKNPGRTVVDAILRVMPVAQEIWFHGSRATGKHRRNSDTDILVVVPDNLVGDKYLGAVRILQKLNSHFDNYDIQPTKTGTNIHRIAQEEGRLLWSKQGVAENFADGKVKGKSRPGRVKRAGASCDGSVTDLRAKARKYGGERGKMYHWCANMKGGKKKANEEYYDGHNFYGAQIGEAIVGNLHFPELTVAVDDHSIERTQTHGIDPKAIDSALKKLGSIIKQLAQMEVNNKVWVYDTANDVALGLRRISSTKPLFKLKTVVGNRPYDGITPIIDIG